MPGSEVSNSKLEGPWINIFKAGDYGPDAQIGSSDLDDIVRNYGADGKKAAVGVELNWSGAKPYGQVDEIRRSGDQLFAKLSNIDPRIQQLHDDGAFKKTAVTLQKTPTGLSLARVGFVKDGSNANLDQLHGDHFDSKEIVFREGPNMHGFVTITNNLLGGPAGREIGRLKAAGYWNPRFNQLLPLFSELEKSSMRIEFGEGSERRLKSPVEMLADVLTYLSRGAEFQEYRTRGVGVGDQNMHREAQRISRERNISYCEALTFAEEEMADVLRDLRFGESSSGSFVYGPIVPAAQAAATQAKSQAIVDRRDGGGPRTPFRQRVLNSIAQRLARAKGIPFGDALEQVEMDARPDALRVAKLKQIPYEDALDQVLADPNRNSSA